MLVHHEKQKSPFFSDATKVAAMSFRAPYLVEASQMPTIDQLRAGFGSVFNIQRPVCDMLFINLDIFSNGYKDELLDQIFLSSNGAVAVLLYSGGVRIDAQKPNEGRTLAARVVNYLEEKNFFLSDCLVDDNGRAFLLSFELNSGICNSRFYFNEKFYDLEFFSPNDVMRVKSVISNNFYEKSMLHHIGMNYVDGDIIDVGANVGNHSVFFSSICKSNCLVHAIEPGGEALTILRRNIFNNCSADSVHILPYAAGESYGSVVLKAGSKKNLGAMRVVGTNVDSVNSILMKTIDHMIPPSRRVSLLKCDVEGFELPALKGAQRILINDKPDIYVEAAKPEFLTQISNFLAEFGYVHKLVFNDTPTHWFKSV